VQVCSAAVTATASRQTIGDGLSFKHNMQDRVCRTRYSELSRHNKHRHILLPMVSLVCRPYAKKLSCRMQNWRDGRRSAHAMAEQTTCNSHCLTRATGRTVEKLCMRVQHEQPNQPFPHSAGDQNCAAGGTQTCLIGSPYEVRSRRIDNPSPIFYIHTMQNVQCTIGSPPTSCEPAGGSRCTKAQLLHLG
jgi:hypothetical protein